MRSAPVFAAGKSENRLASAKEKWDEQPVNAIKRRLQDNKCVKIAYIHLVQRRNHSLNANHEETSGENRQTRKGIRKKEGGKIWPEKKNRNHPTGTVSNH